MTDEQAKNFAFNPFDLTKVWPEADYPLIEVGHFELNRNPGNVFAEIEQAAFSPANIVPGIGCSPDKKLQARLLGVNHHQIPVNAPKCPFHSYHREWRDADRRQPTRRPAQATAAEAIGYLTNHTMATFLTNASRPP